MSTKGFTLIEILCVFFAMTIITLTIPIQLPKPRTSVKSFEQLLLLTQMHAMANKTYARFPLDSLVRFNASGNVNQARTLIIDHEYTCIITLGAGRFYVLP